MQYYVIGYIIRNAQNFKGVHRDSRVIPPPCEKGTRELLRLRGLQEIQERRRTKKPPLPQSAIPIEAPQPTNYSPDWEPPPETQERKPAKPPRFFYLVALLLLLLNSCRRLKATSPETPPTLTPVQIPAKEVITIPELDFKNVTLTQIQKWVSKLPEDERTGTIERMEEFLNNGRLIIVIHKGKEGMVKVYEKDEEGSTTSVTVPFTLKQPTTSLGEMYVTVWGVGAGFEKTLQPDRMFTYTFVEGFLITQERGVQTLEKVPHFEIVPDEEVEAIKKALTQSLTPSSP